MFASTLNGWDKIYHNIQEVIYNENHHSGLPSYFNYFDCQWAQICVQQRHGHYFTSKPTCRCWVWGQQELHQVDAQEAKDHGSLRKQLFDHGQATVNGERALVWLLHPLVRLQPNHCELQMTKYPIKQGNDEYQMCNCGSHWTQVENLQIWKPASEFYAIEGMTAYHKC